MIYALLIGCVAIFLNEIVHWMRQAAFDWRLRRLPPRAQYLPEGWHASQADRFGRAIAAQRRERQ